MSMMIGKVLASFVAYTEIIEVVGFSDIMLVCVIGLLDK